MNSTDRILGAAALLFGLAVYASLTTPAQSPHEPSSTPLSAPHSSPLSSLPSSQGVAPKATTSSSVATDSALNALAGLAVKGRAPRTGYSRALFGPAWQDVDRNGCDTRNDILRRDLRQVVPTAGCVVRSGVLLDPYTGRTVNFYRGVTSSLAVQIDHVVALSDAYQKGAQRLDPSVLAAFANDPLNLLAVNGPANEAKSDSDAASWLPSNKVYRCAYVARQVAVKLKYKLWVTTGERDAIRRVLLSCPTQPLPN